MHGNLTTTQLRSDIFKRLFIVFSILLVILIYIVYLAQNKSFEQYNSTSQKHIHKTIKHTLNHNINQYRNLLIRLLIMEDVSKYVANFDREGLYKVLKPKFDFIKKENQYFTTLHIITKDGKSFLRVHAKDHYGDNIMQLRPMVQEIMKNKTTLIGYETGLHATAFRILMPLYNGKEFLGSIGIGINPNYFINQISELLSEQGMLFLEDQHLKLFSTNIDFKIGNYRLQTQISEKTKELLNALPKGYSFEDSIQITLNDRIYFIHYENLKDYDNRTLGKYLFFEDITDRINSHNTIRWQLIAIVVLFIIIVFILVSGSIMKFSSQLNRFYQDIINTTKENESYLKAVENGSENLIFTIFKGEIFTANRGFLEFMEYKSLDSFKQQYKSIGELFVKRTGYLDRIIDGKDWFKYVVENPNQMHKVIFQKDSQEYIFSVIVSKVTINNDRRYLVTFSDITEIETIKNRYEFAINGAQDGIWDWNLQTNELYFTPQWKKQLGYEDDELKNDLATWEENVHPEDKAQAIKDIQSSQAGETEFYENIHRLRHKDGHWVWILDRGQTIFDENGVAVRMIGSHTDITKIKELEEEIKEKDKVMMTQSRSAAMGEMISMIAHQWRQPLAVISMDANNILADIELDMVEQESLKEISVEIIEQTNELSKTIDDFKEFFKPVKESEMVLVEEVIKKAFSVVGKSLENNNVAVRKIFSSKQEIDTYSRELMQVFINILNNAKEVLIEKNVQTKEILIELEDTEDTIIIKICDNAGGIPDSIIDKIFEPYFSTKDAKTGTGLGLYMSKTIIEKHLSGTLRVVNTHEGACFIIELPFKKANKNIEDK